MKILVACEISIHALLAESDKGGYNVSIDDFVFLSTLSLRRATGAAGADHDQRQYFYPRSPCGERRFWWADIPLICVISIHALLAESDTEMRVALDDIKISIHALLAESDQLTCSL